jgi:hypothetical protein
VLSESVRNFRTVISSSDESKVLKIYSDALIKSLEESKKATLISGALYGIG